MFSAVDCELIPNLSQKLYWFAVLVSEIFLTVGRYHMQVAMLAWTGSLLVFGASYDGFPLSSVGWVNSFVFAQSSSDSLYSAVILITLFANIITMLVLLHKFDGQFLWSVFELVSIWLVTTHCFQFNVTFFEIKLNNITIFVASFNKNKNMQWSLLFDVWATVSAHYQNCLWITIDQFQSQQ